MASADDVHGGVDVEGEFGEAAADVLGVFGAFLGVLVDVVDAVDVEAGVGISHSSAGGVQF